MRISTMSISKLLLCIPFAYVSPNIHLIPSWPPDTFGANVTTIFATILLPVQFYSQNYKRNVAESEAALLPAQKRAGPAILAGLKEGVRRGQAGGGPPVRFEIAFRDTRCDITYGPKVNISYLSK